MIFEYIFWKHPLKKFDLNKSLILRNALYLSVWTGKLQQENQTGMVKTKKPGFSGARLCIHVEGKPATEGCQNVFAVNSDPVHWAAVLPSDSYKANGSGKRFVLRLFFFLQLCPAEVFFFSYATVVRFVISVSDLKDIWKTEAKKNHLHTNESKSDNMCWFRVTMAMGIPSRFSHGDTTHTQQHFLGRTIKLTKKNAFLKSIVEGILPFLKDFFNCLGLWVLWWSKSANSNFTSLVAHPGSPRLSRPPCLHRADNW